MLTVWVPSESASSTAVMANAGLVLCPAAMVTEEGTVASPVSSLARSTTSELVVSPLRVTVAVVLPPFSLMEASAMATVRVSGAEPEATTSMPITSTMSVLPPRPTSLSVKVPLPSTTMPL